MDLGWMDSDRGRHRAYVSFLLRLWRVNVGGVPVWRVSLQRPGEAEQRALAGLDELVAFLRAETAESGGQEAMDVAKITLPHP